MPRRKEKGKGTPSRSAQVVSLGAPSGRNEKDVGKAKEKKRGMRTLLWDRTRMAIGGRERNEPESEPERAEMRCPLPPKERKHAHLPRTTHYAPHHARPIIYSTRPLRSQENPTQPVNGRQAKLSRGDPGNKRGRRESEQRERRQRAYRASTTQRTHASTTIPRRRREERAQRPRDNDERAPQRVRIPTISRAPNPSPSPRPNGLHATEEEADRKPEERAYTHHPRTTRHPLALPHDTTRQERKDRKKKTDRK
ncbi:hypothetical protein B0H14DRAFT_2563054 [Mycena olivaceomarginata]|nr:hypothetical protein B0H14DRAFT_2563054 [Mycena olivaceomarginata]